jgi:hypothetical protein
VPKSQRYVLVDHPLVAAARVGSFFQTPIAHMLEDMLQARHA